MKIQAILVILFGIGLFACGSDASKQDSSKASMEKKQACDLLTTNEVAQVIGEEVKMGKHYSDYDCVYQTIAENENGIPKGKVILRMTMPTFNVNPKEALDSYIKRMKEGLGEDANTFKFKPVDGVGDLAIFEESRATQGSVVLVAFQSTEDNGKPGIIQITTQLVDFQPEKAREFAKSLALKALQRV